MEVEEDDVEMEELPKEAARLAPALVWPVPRRRERASAASVRASCSELLPIWTPSGGRERPLNDGHERASRVAGSLPARKVSLAESSENAADVVLSGVGFFFRRCLIWLIEALEEEDESLESCIVEDGFLDGGDL